MRVLGCPRVRQDEGVGLSSGELLLDVVKQSSSYRVSSAATL